jgi:hypothetical protein
VIWGQTASTAWATVAAIFTGFRCRHLGPQARGGGWGCDYYRYSYDFLGHR